MKAITFNSDYLFDKDYSGYDFPVEIHVSRFHNNQIIVHPNWVENFPTYTIPFDDPSAFKVYINSNEPLTSPNREMLEVVIANHKQYDLILTSDRQLLNSCSNAVFFPYGTTWLNTGKINHPDSIGEYDSSKIDKLHKSKDFSVSFVYSNHTRSIQGYKLRKAIWTYCMTSDGDPLRDEIDPYDYDLKPTFPRKFYSSTRHPPFFPRGIQGGEFLPDDNKENLFNSQFHIAIESSSIENYFSEKLIDALITKTVPVYWGCPNIGEFFDTRGMILVDGAEDAIEKCNKISSTTYEEMLPYVEKNFETAKEYARPFEERVKEMVTENKKIKDKENKLLTIGICTLEERKDFLNRLLGFINQHTDSETIQSVEVIVNSDNGEKSVGQKRNEIISAARGKFVSFVDDDDLISEEYCKLIVDAIKSDDDLDCIGFAGMYYVNGIERMVFKHANAYGGHFKDNDGIQYRPINHLNPVRSEIAKLIGFPDKDFGEDSDYCDRLFKSGLLKKEKIIDSIMYHYYWAQEVTRTH